MWMVKWGCWGNEKRLTTQKGRLGVWIKSCDKVCLDKIFEYLCLIELTLGEVCIIAKKR